MQDLDAWPEGDVRELSYRAGHSHALALLREDLHPDAVRFRLHGVEEISGRELGPDCWRGVNDALAGLPPSP